MGGLLLLFNAAIASAVISFVFLPVTLIWGNSVLILLVADLFLFTWFFVVNQVYMTHDYLVLLLKLSVPDNPDGPIFRDIARIAEIFNQSVLRHCQSKMPVLNTKLNQLRYHPHCKHWYHHPIAG